ncbi:hypothetical protein IAD21_01710 [Abditibacteriota bacterium]|nr:hypothetical protein IAD21_01710 [Abditibacteriota bacterium]
MIPLIAEKDISLARLQAIFEAAFVENDVDEDGDLYIRTENGTKIFVSLDERNKLVRFTALYGLKEDAVEADRTALANTLNDNIVFVRFSATTRNSLVCDYYLPYNGAVSPLHVVTVTRLFNRIIASSLGEYDTADILL